MIQMPRPVGPAVPVGFTTHAMAHDECGADCVGEPTNLGLLRTTTDQASTVHFDRVSDTEPLSLAVGVAQGVGVLFDIVGAFALCLAVPAMVEQSIEIALVEIVAAD